MAQLNLNINSIIYDNPYSGTHWFITESKSQEIWGNDSVELVQKSWPDLNKNIYYFFIENMLSTHTYSTTHV